MSTGPAQTFSPKPMGCASSRGTGPILGTGQRCLYSPGKTALATTFSPDSSRVFHLNSPAQQALLQPNGLKTRGIILGPCHHASWISAYFCKSRVGKMECILRHRIGVCLMVTALNWHAVKDTRADFPQRRGNNHLVLLSSDHPWWSQGAKADCLLCPEHFHSKGSYSTRRAQKGCWAVFSGQRGNPVGTVTIQSFRFWIRSFLRDCLWNLVSSFC